MKNDILARLFVHHHLQNPEMWNAFEKLALAYIQKGKKATGPNALIEQLRWDDVASPANPTEGYKFYDGYTSFYSRMFAHTHPEHAKLFRYKESAANYINYEKLMQGDAKGALNWDDPQMSLPLESK